MRRLFLFSCEDKKERENEKRKKEKKKMKKGKKMKKKMKKEQMGKKGKRTNIFFLDMDERFNLDLQSFN